MTHPRAQSSDRPIDPTDLSLRHAETELPGPFAGAEAGGLGAIAELDELAARRHASLWGDAWRRLIRNRLALFGLFLVVCFVVLAVLAPLIAPYGESEVVN